MEIHTPLNQFNFDHSKAGHTTVYLNGLINTIHLDELEVNPELHVPDYGVKISYLDYVMVNEEGGELEKEHAPFGSMGNSPWGGSADAEYKAMALKMYQKAVEKQEHNIKCDPSENPSIQIQKHLSKDVMDRILALSKKNKDDLAEHFPTGFDIELTGDDMYSDKRKFISRVLTAANMIATHARRGPANFIIIGKDYVDYLRQDIQDDVVFQSMDELGTMAYGMNIFVSGTLGNTVVVGRCPKESSEPGLHLITTNEDISGDILLKDNDIESVDVVYMLEETGAAPERAYLQFNIIDHGN